MIFRPTLNLSKSKSKKSIFQHSTFTVLVLLAVSCFFYGLSVGVNTSSFTIFLTINKIHTKEITKILSTEIVGYIIMAPFMMILSSKIGIKRLVLVSLVFRNLFLGIFGFGNDITYLYMGMLGFGIFGFALYVSIFQWVNSLADDENRATYLSIASVLFGLGIALGPLLLALFEVGVSQTSFKISIALSFIMAIPIFLIHDENKLNANPPISMTKILKFAYVPIICSIASEYVFFALHEFLPLFALRHGKNQYDAYLINAFFGLSSLIFVIPIGILFDKFDRIKVVVCCAAGIMIFIQLLPYSLENTYLTFLIFSPLSACLNGIIIGSLAILGDKFRGKDFMTANTIVYAISAIGGYAGIACTGNAMAMVEKGGLVYSISSLYSVFFMMLVLEGVRARGKNLNHR